jgi:outer membrane murein-binding lipoprotein Lpp
MLTYRKRFPGFPILTGLMGLGMVVLAGCRRVDNGNMDNNVESAVRELASQIAATNDRLDTLAAKLEDRPNSARSVGDNDVRWMIVAGLILFLSLCVLWAILGLNASPENNIEDTQTSEP